MQEPFFRLQRALAEQGVAARAFPKEKLADIPQELAALRDAGKLDHEFCEHFSWLFEPYSPSAEQGQGTILIAAVALPELVFSVSFGGKKRELSLPPGYSHTGCDTQTRQIVSSALTQAGFSCTAAEFPGLKLAAAKSGLCRYGRNNITYCEDIGGMGSALRLYAFLTDMPAPAEFCWGPPARMEACDKCRACTAACPTGCIDVKRQTIHAQRCLVFINEMGGSFPQWLPEEAHNALIGCMACQNACPQNRGKLKKRVVEDAFDETELTAICACGVEELPQKTRDTLHRYDLDEYAYALPRNLRALLR